MKHFSVYIDC